MGRVFKPEALIAGDIPQPGAHEEAGRFILDQFFEPREDWSDQEKTRFEIDGNGIPSGMIYGSTALGSASLRSDVDVLVNFHPSHIDRAFPLIRQVFERAESDYKVPIEPHILYVGALLNPLEHSIDPLFASHLVEVQRQDSPRWSYNWPVDGLLSYSNSSSDQAKVRAIAVRYASGKARQFAKANAAYRGQVDVHVMQRALELPGAIGRKVIAATVPEAEAKPDLGNKYKMAEMTLAGLERYASEFEERAVDYQGRLFRLDQEYDQLLAATLEGSSSIEEYREWLKGSYLDACKMAFEVSYTWSEIIAHKIDAMVGKEVVLANLPQGPSGQDIY